MKRIYVILLLIFSITNICAQDGIMVETPSEKINVSGYVNYCNLGSAVIKAEAIICGGTFDNWYIIPRKNYNTFINNLNQLCNAKRKAEQEAKKQKDAEEKAARDALNAERAAKRKADAEEAAKKKRAVIDARAAKYTAEMRAHNLQQDAAISSAVSQNKARGQEMKVENTGAKIGAEHKYNTGRSKNSTGVNDFETMYGKPQVPCVNIGKYNGQNVCKKGDTIIVAANNKKYLLSRQSPLRNKSANGDYYAVNGINSGIITEDGWYLSKDLQGGDNVIGYITTTSRGNNSTIPGEMARFAQNAADCKFHEITCDKTIENKFKLFCEWQICKMTNSVNVFSLSYNDYEKIIDEDLKLNSKIAASKFAEIFIQVGADNLQNFGVLGKIEKAIKNNGGSAEKILQILKEHNVDVNTSLQDMLINEGVGILTAPYGDVEATRIAQQFATCNKTLAISFRNIVSGKNNETVGDKTVTEFVKDLVRSKDHNKMETEIAEKIKIYRDALFGVVDGCLPNEVSVGLKKHWLYHALKNSPELGEAIGLVSANIVIKYSISKEYKEMLKNHIANCRNKKQFLEKYKNEYQTLFEKNQNSCLEYNKIINKLKSEVDSPFGDKNTQEILSLMKKYVFGNEKISKCDVLSANQLTNKPTMQQTAQVTTENKYDLENAIRAKRGNKTRYYILENNKCIGWVDKENGKETFHKNEGYIEGLNYFGSIYIGNKNPLNPNGTPNFDLPSQDEIDEAAKEHDKCYGRNGLEGVDGVFLTNTGLHCEHDLASACLNYLNIVDLATFNATYLKIPTSNPFYEKRNTKDRAVLVLTLFAAVSVGKAAANITSDVINSDAMKTLGETEIKKYDLLNLRDGKQTVTYTNPTTLISTSGEKFEAKEGDYFVGTFKDGKIVSGKIYDKSGKVKYTITSKPTLQYE